ncbi:MAG: SDR family oxidoreductase [Clostridiales bacterium]|nr:SDR family oxidoreductase [Clostridiales bacterium]
MKTALITGGSRGIGAAIVRAMSENGYRVAFCYKASQDAASRLAHETGAIAIPCDVTDSRQVQSMVAAALGQLGHIDVLVNNAGVAWQGLITDMTDDDWRAVLDTSLTAAFLTCRETLPGMISRRGGRIINISSIWGRVGASCEAAYSAAKAGLIGLTKALAKEVGPSGVTVNCLCPGVIQTDMLACYTPADLSALADETPLCRLGTPEDVAAAVCWLADDAAAFVTGQVIGVDGGFGQ